MAVSNEMAHLLSSLALSYEEKEDSEQAFATYEAALETRKKVEEGLELSETDPDFKSQKLAIADIYGHMGMLCDEAGKFEDALRLYEQAMELRNAYRLSKDDDAAQADILHNMSIVYRTQGNYIKALDCYMQGVCLYCAKYWAGNLPRDRRYVP